MEFWNSDWKMGKFLEWYTELPHFQRPRESPVFFIQNVECCFQFSIDRVDRHYHNVHLKPKTTFENFQPFSLTIGFFRNGFCSRSMRISDTENCVCKIPLSTYRESSKDRERFLFLFNEGVPSSSLRFGEKTEEKTTQADLKSIQIDLEYLSLDFGELLKTGSHSDIQLLCNGGNIPAHRAILAARSKVFSDMFRNNTKENQSSLVNLNTTEKAMMELCLDFIYKGKIPKLSVGKAPNLYKLGHVLKIPSLTKFCADLMVCNASANNYTSYLALSDEHNDDYFKCGLIDYISDHIELLKDISWVLFSEKHLRIANDVYRKCMFKLM